MSACADAACTFGDGGRCRLAGSLSPGQQCPNLGQVPVETELAVPVEAEPARSEHVDHGLASSNAPYAGAFWSGTALGLADLGRFQLGPDPRLLLVAGSEDAGKTCLLVGMWVALANGAFAKDFPCWRFLGSESLRGWRNLSDAAYEWKGDSDRILPRTSFTDLRQPSFLHLRLSQDWGTHLADVLLSDLPGEWFEVWARSAPAGERLLPILPAVHGALLVVDLPRLLNDREYLYEAANQARRLAESCEGRPVAVTLTKCDDETAKGHVPAVDDPATWSVRAQKRLSEILVPLTHTPHRLFCTAAFPGPFDARAPSGVLAPLRWLLAESGPKPIHASPPHAPTGTHPFGWVRQPAVIEP